METKVEVKTGFTPGPWEAGSGGYACWGIFSESDGSEIAYLAEPCDPGNPLKPECAEANARLIAAAPTLLQALERAVRKLRVCTMAGGTSEEFADESLAEFYELLRETRGEAVSA